MLSENEWKEIASNKLELEYKNQQKLGKLLDTITEYMENELKQQQKNKMLLNE